MKSPIQSALEIVMSKFVEKFSGDDVKKLQRGGVAWIVRDGDAESLRWVRLRYVSGCSEEIIRFTTIVEPKIPMVFRRSRIPRMPRFELSVLRDEITSDFAERFLEFVTAYAGGDEGYDWELLRGQSYPHYAWSERAGALSKQRRK